jgi:hypothetical protein
MKTSLYGLVIDVRGPGTEGLDLPGECRADVSITLGDLGPIARGARWSTSASWYRSPFCDEAGNPDFEIRRLSGGEFWCLYYDRTEVIVDGAGTAVYARWVPPATRESTLAYLLGHFLGLVLRLRGVTCLHGSAIAVGKQAVILVGESGAGKSTTAAALARRGFPVVADDFAALTDRETQFLVQPGYPNLLLLPSSVQALWGRPDALPPPTPGWDKLSFDRAHPEFNWCEQVLPLGAVYLLGGRKPGLPRPAIQPLSGAKGLLRLVADSYCGKMLDRERRAGEFATLGRLMRLVPVRSVQPPASIDLLEGLCDAILDDCQSLGMT